MISDNSVIRKICLIGDWAVGKTSLIKRFVLDQYDDKYLATFGSKVYKKRIIFNNGGDNDIDLNLMIWDVMGQPQFKHMRTIAYKGSQGAIIVCDITRKETLYHTALWQAELFGITNRIPFIILVNKVDLQMDAEITPDELKEISEQYNAECLFTSAKTGENVEAAFQKIGKMLTTNIS